MTRYALVTVGTTIFESLTEAVDDQRVWQALTRLGYQKVIVQHGKTRHQFHNISKPHCAVEVECASSGQMCKFAREHTASCTPGSSPYMMQLLALLLRPCIMTSACKLTANCTSASPVTLHHISMQSGMPTLAERIGIVHAWRRLHEYVANLDTLISGAGLVISHCGAGSVFEALSLGVRLLVVPNPILMDNHQAELASLLEQHSWAVRHSLLEHRGCHCCAF